jgi:hypothetical protein
LDKLLLFAETIFGDISLALNEEVIWEVCVGDLSFGKAVLTFCVLEVSGFKYTFPIKTKKKKKLTKKAK